MPASAASWLAVALCLLLAWAPVTGRGPVFCACHCCTFSALMMQLLLSLNCTHMLCTDTHTHTHNIHFIHTRVTCTCTCAHDMCMCMCMYM